MRIKLLYLFRM